MEIKLAKGKEDFLKCWDAVKELRPHLELKQYLSLMNEMNLESYKLIYVELNDRAVSFCGYRYITMLFRGRSIYIDDLSSMPEVRGKGYASALLDYVYNEAIKSEVDSIHLDSGHTRYDAHRLYLNKGYKIRSHHFSIELKKANH